MWYIRETNKKYIFDFLVPKSDKIRHKILHEVVNEYHKIDGKKVYGNIEIAIPVKDLCTKLKISNDELIMCATKMIQADEVSTGDFGNGLAIFGVNFALASYADKKYLKEGEAYSVGRIKDLLGISAAAIAIIGTVISATVAILTFLQTKKNTESVENMQTKINTIQAQIKRAGLK